MNYKLISLHIAYGLLLATGVAFGMEKESTNPEQQLYVVVTYTNDKNEDIWNFFGQDGNAAKEITRDTIKSTSLCNFTLKYNETMQTLCSKKKNVSLTDLKLSDAQIDIARRIIEVGISKAYVSINNELFPLSDLKQVSDTRQRSSSLPVTKRENSATTQSEKNGDPEDFLTLGTNSTTDSDREKALQILAKTYSNKITLDNPEDNNKKPSSGYTAKHYFIGGLGIGFIAGGIIAILRYPDKTTQLFQSLSDQMRQILQSIQNYASSFQNNPINGIAA